MIYCKDIKFSYPVGTFELTIGSLEVDQNEQVAVTGSSGIGKTTLLYLLAGIYQAQSGQISIDDITLTQYNDVERRDFRIVSLGLVFQEFELLEYLTVWDNILLPYFINPVLIRTHEVASRAMDLLTATGLSGKKRRYPHQLSQGERQRVAVCRALVTQPSVLLCDEPTGNLDPVNRDQVLKLLLDYSQEQKAPLVLVTHDHQILDRFSRNIDIGALA
jgi:putative ABC transport system ATP-binding protein